MGGSPIFATHWPPRSSTIHQMSTVCHPPSQAIANHLSPSINHNQERLVRGQQIGLGSSYEACGSKDRELVQPSTVHRLRIQCAAR